MASGEAGCQGGPTEPGAARESLLTVCSPGQVASPSDPTWASVIRSRLHTARWQGSRTDAGGELECQVLDSRVVLLLVPEEGNRKEEGSEEESEGNCLYFKK